MKKTDTPKAATKKPYRVPRLTRYGEVRLLTQSATGTQTENMTPQTGKMPSERSLKQDIVRIGTHPAGFGLYLYEYRPEWRGRFGDGRRLGAMADEVERVLPAAVSRHPDGYRMVDYAMLGIAHEPR